MTVETAAQIFFAFMSVGIIIWVLSLIFVSRIGRVKQTVPNVRDSNSEAKHGWVVGEVKSQTGSDELIKRLSRLFLRQSLGITNSTFAIADQSERSLTIERLGSTLCNQPGAFYFSRVQFQMESGPTGETTVHYLIDQSPVMSLLRRFGIRFVCFVSLPALIIIGATIWFAVVQNDNATIRYQVFQCAQIVHFLWPPFMLVGLARVAKRQPSQFVEKMIHLAGDEELCNMPVIANLSFGPR